MSAIKKLLNVTKSSSARRAFSQAALPREEVYRIAQEVHAQLWDPAKEPGIALPDYDGMTPDLQEYLTPSGPAGYTKPARKVRPTKIADSALDLVGNTPLIRMDRMAKYLGIKAEILGKCEYYSAGGSVKDRIGLRMIEEQERAGLLKPGDTLIEPTSGNTGVGLCLAAALKGYNVIITLPQKMSGEKVNMMKSLGALILRTPTEASWNDTNSHLFLAMRLKAKIPRSHVLDQYLNKGNPLAHYENTAEEIIEQCDGHVPHAVLTAGTGGTITGVAAKLKEKTNTKVCGVDPAGSILALPETLNSEGIGVPYHVEGIGYDFIPTVLKRDIADVWYKSHDAESFAYARALIRHEGVMIGGSCGSAMWGVHKYVKDNNLGEGDRVVVLFPDASRNYMSKFLCDDWMTQNGFSTDPLPSTGMNV